MLIKIIRAASSKVNNESEEADLTPAFDYQNYGITPKMARDQLKKLVAIEGFDHNEDGEEIVYIRYMSAAEMREKKDYEIEIKTTLYNSRSYKSLIYTSSSPKLSTKPIFALVLFISCIQTGLSP